MRGPLPILICLLAAVATACTGQAPQLLPRSAPPALLSMQTPQQLLARLDQARGPSFSPAEAYRDGADYAQALPSARVSVNGPELQFSPEPAAKGLDAAAYAIYDFTLPAPDSGLLVSLLWETAPAAGNAWLALGNFAQQRWDWQPLDDPDALSLADAAAYYGPGDRLLLAVLVSTDSGVSLRSIQLYAGEAPSAVLQLTPATVDVGDEVVMDGSGSTDLEGAIERYEWDSDGDGSFETDGGAVSSFSVFPAQPGTFSLGLRVTDASGRTATTSQALSVQPFAAPQTLDGASPSGLYTSLAVVNGRPAICYLDSSIAALRFVRAQDSTGSSWDAPVTVDSAGSPGFYNSLIIVNGRPAVAYCALGDVELRYARASDADGAAWGVPQVLDSADLTGLYCSMTLVNGLPAISYYDSNNGNLRFILASDIDGGAWALPQTIDSSGDTGQYTCLRMINGAPAVCYYYATDGDLRYLRASDPFGLTWPAPQTLDSTGFTGIWPSMETVDGQPAIAYQDGSTGDLRYIRASDADGSTWGDAQSLDPGFNATETVSLELIKGRPAIAYCADGTLRYLRALDASGVSWGGGQTLDNAGSTGQYVSLAEVDGQAAISYYDNTGGLLRYIRGN